MSVVYLDCFAGISGNMLLGALIDAGLPETALRDALAKLPVEGYELLIDRVIKTGISATYVDVHLQHHHGHDHDHGDHHHHRFLRDINEIIDQSTLPERVKDNSKKVFLRLAEAEAKVHGTSIDKIHFHEVGAVDSIVDIIGTVFGFDYLGITHIYASRLHVGNGFVQCAHGMMPVPAPATAELLSGIPYYSGEVYKELVTPTGAALVAALCSGFGGMPDGFVSKKVGYGAGSWELPIPNVLRMHIGETAANGAQEDLLVAETNIDDCNPQVYNYVMDKLFDAGALDVWLTPIIMKKGRPATMVSVLMPPRLKDSVLQILLAETTTIGIRFYAVQRAAAERSFVTVTSPWGEATVKVSTYQGKVCTVTPEFDDCRRIAEAYNIPLKTVQQTLLQAAGQA